MVGGQMIDISAERATLDLDGISHLQSLKPGALIRFSCEAGALLAEPAAAERAALVAYAQALGLAFQIADDLIAAESTPGALGRPTGQDALHGPPTSVGHPCMRRDDG